MAQYRLFGEYSSDLRSSLKLTSGSVTVKRAVRVETSLRSGVNDITIDVEDDDLLEVEMENGFTLWTTIDRLQQDFTHHPARDGSDGTFPTHYPSAATDNERGATSTAIKVIRVLGYDVPKEGAKYIATKVEKEPKGDGKFFHVSLNGMLSREDPVSAASEQPTLVLIHGTASSTQGAFAGFFAKSNDAKNIGSNDIWEEIYAHYEGRVYAFEHRTLTKSPLENAIELLRALPANANLHFVTHSRGGLIGDLLSFGGVEGQVFPSSDVEEELQASFKKGSDGYLAEKRRYEDYNLLIAEKKPRVARYVRVGCPAAGTTLASKRLDVYFSVLVNLLGKVPAVGFALEGLGELTAAVAKQRTDPGVLPGLEAQMPGSALVRLLNSSPHVLDSDLTVLAADSEGFLKNLTNLFFWRENDLVVDTRSMYGGALRSKRLWHKEENKAVTHVNYFWRPETARVVQRGLMRSDLDHTGFNTHKPKKVARGKIETASVPDQLDLTAIFLLPGIMGSNLAVKKDSHWDTLWLDKSDLMRGRGRRLALDSGYSVKAETVFDSPYEDFVEDLIRNDLHVMPFPYDWRLSLERAVEQLLPKIQKRLSLSSEPVHLVAHSMGGLVASLLIRQYPDTWRELRERGGRLVQVGTPNLGSYVIPQILQGKNRMLRVIALLDMKNDIDNWTSWVSQFPGILELAPTFGGLDFSRRKTWKALGVTNPPSVKKLRDAFGIAGQLKEQTQNLATEGVIYVAGGPYDTPVYDSETDSIMVTERGDGRVTWDSGIPPGAPTWYIPTKHGSLLNTRNAFPGLRELILDGHTNQIASEEPTASAALRCGELESPPLRDEELIDYIPSTRDLEASVLGMIEEDKPETKQRLDLPGFRLSIIHGDLRFSRHPVVVGHYRGDLIVHAEAILDQRLGGALSARHQLKIYPSDVGTNEVLLKVMEDEKPEGAIVVGLGNIGELTPAQLSRSLELGLLSFAQTCQEMGLLTDSMKISALLVGSGEAGIGLRDSLEAFLSAASNTNRALARLHQAKQIPGIALAAPQPFLAEIELIEIYEDRALEALHRLRELPITGDFTINPVMERRSGGLQRLRGKPDNWWSRVEIRAEAFGIEQDCNRREQLTFIDHGQRARVEEDTQNVQKALVDKLIADALRSGRASDSILSKTLFQMLVPNILRGDNEQRNVQLILDRRAAAYPWEMVMDRRSEPADRNNFSGVIRQLRVKDAKPVVHSEENGILIVGDPHSHLSELKGAQQEAEEVATVFKQRESWKVVTQIRSIDRSMNVSSIMTSFINEDVRILHLAGHGEYDAQDPIRSGMVIGTTVGGDCPILLTAAEVAAKNVTPELVFINCCHLGKIEELKAYHDMAANLAIAFIESGVKAVIAAGWPVDDHEATEFSAHFYREMLDGAYFGSAVNAARERIRFRDSNTWAAYQCYGDPGFRLLMDAGVRSRVREGASSGPQYRDHSELIIAARNLVSRLRAESTAEQQESIGVELDALYDSVAQNKWSEKVGVLSALAGVAGELGQFERAISLYRKALKLDESGVTITDLEQLANFEMRHGKESNDIELIKQAIDSILKINQEHGPTSERLSLLGAGYKRLAQMNNSRAAVRDTLRELTKVYYAAAALDSNHYYPATNALIGIVLLGGPWDSTPKSSAAAASAKIADWTARATFNATLNKLEATVRSIPAKNFWDAIAQEDVRVIRAISSDDPDVLLGQLMRNYATAFERYGSSRQRDSVINQWEFIRDSARTMGHKQMAQLIERLCEMPEH